MIQAASRIKTFFGSRTSEIMSRYRRCNRLAQSLETLADEVRELTAKRATWREQHDDQIVALTASRDEIAKQRDAQDRRVVELRHEHESTEHSIRTLLHRIGVWVQHLLSPGTPGVKQRRQRIEQLSDDIAAAERSLDEISARLIKVTRNLQRLTVPIESFDFAIEYLGQQLESDRRDLDEQNQAIDLAIRLVAKNNSPGLLQVKLSSGLESLADKVLDLKQVLATLDRPATTEVAGEEDSPALELISSAIREGSYDDKFRASGKVFVEGTGTTHVRKTRSETEWYTDAHGNRRTRTRNKTYWDRVNVEFGGPVRAEFEVEHRRWQATAFFDAVKAVCEQRFAAGMNRVQDATNERRAKMEQRAEELTMAIRHNIERECGG